MKQLYKLLNLCALLVATTLASDAQITVDATLGTATGSYATLKAAFDNINNGTHQGDILISVHDSTVETATCVLDSSGNGTGSSFTSILIRPADTATVLKAIRFTTTGSSSLSLNGADSVTIDGRPLSSGSMILLRFTHTGTTAGSHNINLTNGTHAFAVRYCSFIHATTGLVVASNILLSTSVAPRLPNTDIRIENCILRGGRASIYLSATAANPMDSIWILKNELVDFAAVGILSTTGSFKKVVIDSNIIYQTANAPNAPSGIDIRHNAIGTNLEITRNRIYDMQTATTNFIRGIVVSPATTSTGTVILVANNFISLMQNGGSGANVRGFEFGGAGDVTCRFIHNTIRIGGTHVAGTAGTVATVGILKSNTSALSTWICRSNISINNRTGGTTGLFHTAAWVSGNGTSLVGTYDIDYNIYWATGGAGNGPFPGTWNTTLQPQAGQTAYRNAANPQEQHTIFGNVSFTGNTDLTLTGSSINDFLLMGVALDPSILTDIFGNARLSPTYKGAHQSDPFTNLKDGAIKEVYTLGKLPIPYAIPHVIRASVVNLGVDTLFAQQVDVLVSGANSFTDSQVIDTILPGESKYVSFNPYSYSTTGNCLVTVSVPNDSNNTNNSKSFNQIITTDVYAYAEPTLPPAGGVGFNGVGGDFIAKFPYSGSNNINQVGVNFNTGGQPYQIVIYDILNDTPGTLLWNSTTQTSVIGNNTIPVIPAVGITGSFFVGVRQTGTVNVGFGYQAEDPIRNQTFYYKATTVTNWADFATTNSAFRFMVEPRLQVADDIGPQAVVLPCLSVPQGSPAFSPSVKVLNYGLNTRNDFIVSYEITGPVNSSGTDTFSSVGLASSQSVVLGLSNLFNPNTAGTYTFKMWTQIIGATDLAMGNDTFTSNFDVVNINTAANGGNQLTLNGTNQSASAEGSGSLNITGSMLSIESWVKQTASGGERYIVQKDNEQSSSGYSLLLNATGNVVFRITTLSGLDSIVSTIPVPFGLYTHIAVTYNGTIGETRIFINGEESGFKVISLPLVGNTTPLYIGKGTTAGYLGGSIDELKIWDTTRTMMQIREGLHTRLANLYHPNLKAYWRMDESTGSVIADASGNCNAALLGNGGTFAATEIPLGTPVLYSQPVIGSGLTTFAGANMDLTIYNQSGNNDYYIHKFAGAPEGTSPTLIPGGVATIFPQNWIVYRYGTGTMDSAQVTINTNGITLAADPNDFFLYRRSNGSLGGWVLSTTAASADPNTGLVTFTTSSGNYNNQFVVGANNNPLPVTLLYLKATRQHLDAKIIWSTASETENAGFDIQRSTDGKSFTTVGFVKGNGTKSSASGYAYTDANVFNTTRFPLIYYRLAQKDFNGKIVYSAVVSVHKDEQTTTTETVFPNPFSNGIYIETAAPQGSYLNIKVTDLQGKTLHESNITIPASGLVDMSELADLPKGIYFIHTQTNSGTSVRKIVKQ